MRNLKKFILLISAIFYCIGLSAIPVRHRQSIFTQPDGTTVTVRHYGDEWMHWSTTLDGAAVVKDADGYLDVEIEKSPAEITIRFKDGGKKFNPLEREMPDTSLPLEERSIGGLGILLTIKQMDSVNYEYSGTENILTIKKTISNEK